MRVLRQDIRAAESRARLRARPSSACRHCARGAEAASRRTAMLHWPRAVSWPRSPRWWNGTSGQASGVVIAALTGMAGIGKTALAVHWAHQVADRFPDGQLFVNLRGSGPSGTPVTPTDAVRGFLTALGVPPARIPPDTDGQAALYRSLLAGRRMLIVLDNAQDAEQVRPLLPGSPGCLVLVTSRNRLTGLAAAEGAHLITLGVLTEGESRDLLASNLGAGRAMAEPAAVSELIALCGRPAAGPVRRRRPRRRAPRPAAGRARGRDAGRAEAAGRAGDGGVGHQRPDGVLLVAGQARRSRGADVPPAGDPSGTGYHGSGRGQPRWAAAADRRYLALAELCDEHLLTEYVPGRYICHDLLRSYAAEEASTRDSEADRHAAVHRVLDYYLHAADRASTVLYPSYTRLTRDQPWPGVVPEEIAGRAQAAEWFENERHVLLATIDQAPPRASRPTPGSCRMSPGCSSAASRSGASSPRPRSPRCRRRQARRPGRAGPGLLPPRPAEGVPRRSRRRPPLSGRGHRAGRALGDRKLCTLAGLVRVAVLQSQDRTLEASVQTGRFLPVLRA